MSSVAQVKQMVRISRELDREIADGDDTRRIYRICTWYQSAAETLRQLGLPSNRIAGQRGVPSRVT